MATHSVDRVHKDAALGEVLGGRARHHVDGRLGHVGVRVVRRLRAVELALHRAHVDDELAFVFALIVKSFTAQSAEMTTSSFNSTDGLRYLLEKWDSALVENERRHRVDRKHLDQLCI